MKKRVRKAVVALMLVSALGTQYANAASIKYEGSNIIVSGTIASEQEGQEVALQIIGPFDEAVEDIEAALSKELDGPQELEATYYTHVITTEGGNYEFSVGGMQIGKFYGVAIKEPGTPLVTNALYLAEQAMINAALLQINQATGAAGIKAVFETEEYYDMLVSNYAIFNGIESVADKDKVYELIYNDKGNGFTTFSEFEKSLTSASAIVRTSAEDDEDAALEYMEYIDLSEAETGLYSSFLQSDADAKRGIIKRVMDQKPGNYEEYIDRFNEACFLQKIQDEQYATNLTKLLNDYEDLFSFDLSGYSSVSSKVNPKLAGKEYATISDFKDALKKAVNDSKAAGNTGGGGGGGRTPDSNSGSNPIINQPPAPEQTPTTNFDDLDSVAWAKDAIEELANRGIVAGKEERLFYPNDVIKREEFVQLVVSAFGLADDAAAVEFADVPADAWYYRAVASGVKSGLIYGMDENYFGTGRGITRQDLAAIIYRYLVSEGEEFSSDTTLFADDDKIADYAREAVYALKSKGILSGTDNNNFQPDREATRAESARIIATVLGV